MNNPYFDIKDTLYDITEKYSEATALLIALGFEHLKDETMRKNFGQSISLQDALKLKKINLETFEAELIHKIENSDKKLASSSKVPLKITGVLPCPVKVPLTETFEKWLDEQKFDFGVKYELKAASMGIDWLKADLEQQSKEALPDLFISAGFELFFDKKGFGKYITDGVFEDLSDIKEYHEDFHNDYMVLDDPDRRYSMVGIVPAIFLVNTDELKGRAMPTSWEDLFKEEFENSISLPLSDFDLFNAILLNIYKNYGEYGVKRLGKSLQRSMHPSEMVKSHTKKYEKPAITIMPYFFTWMVKEGSPMAAVWPKDGAIISPIFMLSKKEKREQLKPIVDFFASEEVGTILAHKGKFPSVNPKVDNKVPKENKYMWLGWDYIKSQDISSLIKKCEALFDEGVKGDVTV